MRSYFCIDMEKNTIVTACPPTSRTRCDGQDGREVLFFLSWSRNEQNIRHVWTIMNHPPTTVLSFFHPPSHTRHASLEYEADEGMVDSMDTGWKCGPWPRVLRGRARGTDRLLNDGEHWTLRSPLLVLLTHTPRQQNDCEAIAKRLHSSKKVTLSKKPTNHVLARSSGHPRDGGRRPRLVLLLH